MPLAADEFSGLTHLGSGKVRELFAVQDADGDDAILLVASDRISAFDVILPSEIPDKGAVLTALSLWWFEQLADLVPSHVISAKVADYPAELQPYAAQLVRSLDALSAARRWRRSSASPAATSPARASRTTRPPVRSRGTRCRPGLLDGSKLPGADLHARAPRPRSVEHDENITRDQAAGGARLPTSPASWSD